MSRFVSKSAVAKNSFSNDTVCMSKKNTSWGEVAEWYHEYLSGEEDSFQNKVILPNILRLANLKKGEVVLDLACGEGFFSREFAKTGVSVIGADISKDLIEIAKRESPEIRYEVSPSDNLSFLQDGSVEKIAVVLAIQNIEKVKETFEECKRILKPRGKIFMVMNHPAFRVPKASEWGFDEEKDAQYRRVDKYLSESKVEIAMHPGGAPDKKTVSFHRSLQYYFKLLANSGFAVAKLEEWISHKKSETGPRQKAEDDARKEIPLFLFIEAVKL